MEATINEKAMRGIEMFLNRRGIDILDTDWAHGSDRIDFVAEDEGELVFISTTVRDNTGEGLGPELVDRDSAERLAAAWLRDHQDYPESAVRFDIVTMLVLGDHKAFVRHHRNAWSAGI